MNKEKEQTPEAEIVVPSGRDVIEITPFGTTDKLKLSIHIVRNMIAVPTKTGKQPDDNQCIKFMMLCKSRHLNPFDGDCYMLGYDSQSGPQFSLITAHQVFLKRAEASEGFDGMESGVILRMPEGGIVEREGDFVDDGERLVGGWAKVYRKNLAKPIYRRLKLSVFNTGRSRWEKDPAGMIVKCAEADCLRTAFPTHLGGLYVGEELPPIDMVDSNTSGGRLLIKRAQVPKQLGNGDEKKTEPDSSVMPEAASSPSPIAETIQRHVSDWDRFGESAAKSPEPTQAATEPEKKTEKPLTRKRRNARSETPTPVQEIPPNQAEMLKRLTAGNKTPADLVRVAFANEWVSGDERWPFSEEKLAKFLTEENWPTITEELDALPKS